MYSGHARLCVCLSAAACPHYCTYPDVTWGMVEGCSVVVHCCADLQSVHVVRCYGNIARTRNVSECLQSLYAWLLFPSIKSSFASRIARGANFTYSINSDVFFSVFRPVYIQRRRVSSLKVKFGVKESRGGWDPMHN